MLCAGGTSASYALPSVAGSCSALPALGAAKPLCAGEAASLAAACRPACSIQSAPKAAAGERPGPATAKASCVLGSALLLTSALALQAAAVASGGAVAEDFSPARLLDGGCPSVRPECFLSSWVQSVTAQAAAGRLIMPEAAVAAPWWVSLHGACSSCGTQSGTVLTWLYRA